MPCQIDTATLLTQLSMASNLIEVGFASSSLTHTIDGLGLCHLGRHHSSWLIVFPHTRVELMEYNTAQKSPFPALQYKPDLTSTAGRHGIFTGPYYNPADTASVICRMRKWSSIGRTVLRLKSYSASNFRSMRSLEVARS